MILTIFNVDVNERVGEMLKIVNILQINIEIISIFVKNN